jgi:hypothetical protein
LKYAIIKAVLNFRKGDNMEPKIVNCECGEFIGVQTDKGILIENIIAIELSSKCNNCERWIDYNGFESEEITFRIEDEIE